MKSDLNLFYDELDGESFEMKNMNVGIRVFVMYDIVEEREYDEWDKFFLNKDFFEDEFIDNNL